MQKSLKNIIAIVAGVIIGGVVNYALVIAGSVMVAPPPGVDMSDMTSIADNIDQFGPMNFLVPFLAHALGTFTGALATCTLAVDYKRVLTLAIGCIFLAGGLSAALMIPAPAWFIAADLLLAYLPMAWLALLVGKATRAG